MTNVKWIRKINEEYGEGAFKDADKRLIVDHSPWWCHHKCKSARIGNKWKYYYCCDDCKKEFVIPFEEYKEHIVTLCRNKTLEIFTTAYTKKFYKDDVEMEMKWN